MEFINPNFKTVMDFGVSWGGTLRVIRNKLNNNFKIYAFDSFEGLPEDWTNTPQKKGAFSTSGKIPDVENVSFYVGWFDDTLPKFIKEVEAEPAALIHLDCDLYSSTKTVLSSINKFIVKDTIIVFDEWIYNNDLKCTDHEQRAFLEWAQENDISFKIINFIDKTGNGDERKIVKIV
jgi:hypothetical protein